MNEIVPGLFLGDAESTLTLAENGIECVLNVAGPNVGYTEMVHEYRVIVLLDSWNADKRLLRIVIPDAVDFINKHYGKRRVLVHCSAGRSRSAAVVIAWIMLRLRLTYEEAFALVRLKRPEIEPNHGFVVALQSLKVL